VGDPSSVLLFVGYRADHLGHVLRLLMGVLLALCTVVALSRENAEVAPERFLEADQWGRSEPGQAYWWRIIASCVVSEV